MKIAIVLLSLVAIVIAAPRPQISLVPWPIPSVITPAPRTRQANQHPLGQQQQDQQAIHQLLQKWKLRQQLGSYFSG